MLCVTIYIIAEIVVGVIINNCGQVKAVTDQEFGCGIERVLKHYQAW